MMFRNSQLLVCWDLDMTLHGDLTHCELQNLLSHHFSDIAIALVGVAITLVCQYLSLRIIEKLQCSISKSQIDLGNAPMTLRVCGRKPPLPPCFRCLCAQLSLLVWKIGSVMMQTMSKQNTWYCFLPYERWQTILGSMFTSHVICGVKKTVFEDKKGIF